VSPTETSSSTRREIAVEIPVEEVTRETNALIQKYQKLARIPDENHEMNWAEAAKGKTAASCPFEYAAKLTEVMLLGVVALRAGKKIVYDGANMRVTNDERANDFLQRTPGAASSNIVA
jgi:hypothetical protein